MDYPSPRLILASTSRYRRQLLQRLQIPFETIAPGVDESAHDKESPQELAVRLSTEKARVVSAAEHDAWVIGSDQVAALGSRLLGKPGSVEAAASQLAACSGAQVTFYTAVSLVRADQLIGRRTVETLVEFRELGDAEIRDYVAREQPLDCAGSFRWEGLGICLFKALHSEDPTALEGLPLISVCELLRESGLNILKTTI